MVEGRAGPVAVSLAEAGTVRLEVKSAHSVVDTATVVKVAQELVARYQQ